MKKTLEKKVLEAIRLSMIALKEAKCVIGTQNFGNHLVSVDTALDAIDDLGDHDCKADVEDGCQDCDK